MEALILAADNNNVLENDPICFTKTIGSVRLIEYHIRILNLLGFDKEKITVAIGKDGVWKDKKINIGAKIMVLSNLGKKSGYSFMHFIKKISEDINGLLIINANSFFELSDLENLISERMQSKILVEKRNNFYTKGLELLVDGDTIINVSKKLPNKLPWYSYYGACYLSKKDIKSIYSLNIKQNEPYLTLLINILQIKCKKQDVHEEYHQKNSLELIGGSFAGLSKEILVKKYANKEGNEKLIQEIKWLNSLPLELANKFPKVLDYKISSTHSHFIMPYYKLENLRKKIITGIFSSTDTKYFLEKILNFMFKNLYSKILSKADENFTKQKHFNRFFERIKLIERISPFDKILKNKTVIINGEKYMNLSLMIQKLYEFNEKTRLFNPKNLVMIHGDLHFQNMLIDSSNDDFILADPRGELFGSDIYYDFGKLWHSFNGLYDLIHTDIAKTCLLKFNSNESEFTLFLADEGLLNTYANIKQEVQSLILNYPISEDKDYELKIKFAEVMHFSSLMYFHLKKDGVENRALSLYLQSIKLAHNLLEELHSINGGGGYIRVYYFSDLHFYLERM